MLIPGQKLTVAHLRAPVTYVGPGRCGWGLVGCRRAILWAITAKGKRIPLDPRPNAWSIYSHHNATCPDAARFRQWKAR